MSKAPSYLVNLALRRDFDIPYTNPDVIRMICERNTWGIVTGEEFESLVEQVTEELVKRKPTIN